MYFCKSLVDFLKNKEKLFLVQLTLKSVNFFESWVDIFDIEYYLIIILDSLMI